MMVPEQYTKAKSLPSRTRLGPGSISRLQIQSSGTTSPVQVMDQGTAGTSAPYTGTVCREGSRWAELLLGLAFQVDPCSTKALVSP